MQASRIITFILIAAFGAASAAHAQECGPPAGFVDVPHPAIAPAEQLVSHTEEINVERPLATVLDVVFKASLKDKIHKAGSLPGVSGDHPLNEIPFGAPGSRRLVCLSDGTTLEEQVLEREQTNTSYRFRYVVWNYTTKQARPIEYGVGYFYYLELGGRQTHISWTYSFKLKNHEFPGYLGAVGRYLFRKTFLERQYAEMMRGTLAGTKSDAEHL